ncbi:dihydrodipicolinate synthase family protein [Paenibacillus hemerocallicola]|uniref:Dihydrodipicolinate synthase family protein n=1 Tax=Paenibacillus hemerocallicola TaxID=1172614 RepID=A0A5C4TDR2_9BACL|nr:dihydrodipicolinate synthase family protein [Paenibacillus hemerocallicola]TNJ66647.1 dihydrodipicolinate synthase family protein [Paenibacillus hemerocallicola]
MKGIYTALLTPMDERGEIDFESLGALIRHQLAHGVQGFYAGGSTGEAFLLTAKERMELLEAVIGYTAGKAKVIAHTGGIGTRESVELARHAEKAGADAVSAVVPFYYKPGIQEIRDHYRSIMSAVSVPMIVYHYPGATGVSLTMDFYESMAADPQCMGVKFTSMNLFEMQQIRARCGPGFLIMNGHDEVYAAGALMGADGAIGSTFNMMPSLFTDMFARAESGRWDALPELQTQANEVIGHMLQFDVIPYEKYVLYLQGVLRTPTVRSPLKRFTGEEEARIESFYSGNPLLVRHASQPAAGQIGGTGA